MDHQALCSKFIINGNCNGLGCTSAVIINPNFGHFALYQALAYLTSLFEPVGDFPAPVSIEPYLDLSPSA
ncbi:uncharacterized protein ANIA_11352 [Aspergillus nidulans FGSC A4]|uniref:Uncharacterized protein n=1 Tax=Emericella nidulans (strain FGSC A4 / ATCC 38163 / CBS 112.46 / NRRL 194 / M139) TaxID=227321 RepID=C8VKM9_EMENI|nr:hypothetical protein [Aspergillus nidulans FGSC A4]CBF87192.1 TPA: hypothetical protein ANIA_11352 [Aspergillus nidulans FGSC A4]